MRPRSRGEYLKQHKERVPQDQPSTNSRLSLRAAPYERKVAVAVGGGGGGVAVTEERGRVKKKNPTSLC